MSDIRMPTREEVTDKIDDELKLVCKLAATLMSGSMGYGNDLSAAVKDGYAILDSARNWQENRVQIAIAKEYKRRRGY